MIASSTLHSLNRQPVPFRTNFRQQFARSLITRFTPAVLRRLFPILRVYIYLGEHCILLFCDRESNDDVRFRSNMTYRHNSIACLAAGVLTLCFGVRTQLRAQAGAGPIVPNPPSSAAPVTSGNAPQTAAPVNRPEPRTSIVGAWTLERDAYANQQGRNQQQDRRNAGRNGPYGGNGPGGNGPYGPGPYGGRRRGGVGGYPGGGRNRGGVNQTARERQALQELLSRKFTQN
jgi:hypothetical protein